ncbi:MAG: hypothetical protein K2K16_12715, partial [Ruminococcus sp.]|nr:hypothetical protein [Ruminococcus sp.]
MKKILIFVSVLLMISGVSCNEKSVTSTSEMETSADNPESIEITQLMYKQEHLSFPEDMSERMG